MNFLFDSKLVWESHSWRIFLTLFFFITVPVSVYGQTTEADGNWESNNTWIGNSPGVTGLGNPNIIVNHKVYVGSSTESGLTFAGNNDSRSITVNDTLIIYGDVSFANKAMDFIINGSVIIIGDLILNNKIDIESDGTLVVTGEISKGGSANQGSVTGDGTIYAGSYSSTAVDFIGGSLDDQDFMQLLDDLDEDVLGDPGLQDIIDFINNDFETPLPITLASFRAIVNESTIGLNWVTLSELNFEYFNIQRANEDGQFESVGALPGNGTTNGPVEYFWTDETPHIGINYYRLVSNDFDGYQEVFKPVVVVFEPDSWDLTIYPNPAPEGQSFSLKGLYQTEASVSIYTLDGKRLLHTKTCDQTVQIDDWIPKGLYLIHVEINGLQKTERLIVR